MQVGNDDSKAASGGRPAAVDSHSSDGKEGSLAGGAGAGEGEEDEDEGGDSATAYDGAGNRVVQLDKLLGVQGAAGGGFDAGAALLEKLKSLRKAQAGESAGRGVGVAADELEDDAEGTDAEEGAAGGKEHQEEKVGNAKAGVGAAGVSDSDVDPGQLVDGESVGHGAVSEAAAEGAGGKTGQQVQSVEGVAADADQPALGKELLSST